MKKLEEKTAICDNIKCMSKDWWCYWVGWTIQHKFASVMWGQRLWISWPQPIFTLGDGYLSQGNELHLTKEGLNKLAKNLKLNVKTGVSDVTKSYQPRNSTPEVSHMSGQRQHCGKGPHHWGYKSDQRISVNGVTRSGSIKTLEVKWNPDVIYNSDGCVMRVGTAHPNVITDTGALSFATCAGSRSQSKTPHLGSWQRW